MIETKPFRSPMFQGIRIRVRANGEIVNNSTGKVIALITSNPATRKVVSFESPATKKERTEYLSKFLYSDWLPLLAKLRATGKSTKQATKPETQALGAADDAKRATVQTAIAQALSEAAK